MSQITVQLPNARRQAHKVSPNTTILEVIEQVCEKAGLDPEEYDLKHHRNVLDSNNTIRFSSIPQNAQLELVPAKTKRKQSKIVLCVQLENSERFQGECFPTDTLWDAITKIASDQLLACSSPVIIYMRREVIGSENLKNTNLRSIGLSGGRAVVRLIDKRLEDLRTQANVSGLLQRTANKDEDESFDKHLEADTRAENENGNETNISKKLEEVEQLDSELPIVISQPVEQVAVINDSVQMACHENLIPSESLKANNEINHIEDPDEKIDCKRARTKSPDNLQIEKVVLLGDRNAVAFNLDTIQAPTIEDLPDDFYELTLADAKSLVAAARRAIAELENAPLLTSAQRKLDEDGLILQKLSSHKSCVIRIKFPDRTVLQGVFKPLETFTEVYNFVKSYLEEPSLPFCLYTTPPKNVINEEARLVEADCVPGANLYFGSLTENVPKSFLKSEVLQKFSSFSAVTNAAHGARKSTSIVKKPESESTPQSSINNPKPGPSRMACVGTNKTTTPNNVPKWFKINK